MEGRTLIVVAALRTEEGNAAAVGELDVVPVIAELLDSFYGERVSSPLLSSDVSCFPRFAGDGWRDFNLVLFGGPLTNPYTEQVLRDTGGLACSFVPGEHRVRVPGIPEDETRYHEAENGFVQQDWGLFYRMPSPYAENRRVYVFAGCTTQGTAASAAASLLENLIPSLLASPISPQRPVPRGAPVNEAAVSVSRNMREDYVERAIQVRYPQLSPEESNPHGLRAAKQQFRERRRSRSDGEAVVEVDFPEPDIDDIYSSFESFRGEMRDVVKL